MYVIRQDLKLLQLVHVHVIVYKLFISLDAYIASLNHSFFYAIPINTPIHAKAPQQMIYICFILSDAFDCNKHI